MTPNRKTYIILAIYLAASFLPLFTTGYTLRVATTVIMFIGISQAWNILGGYGGYVSFGHAAFFGVGAYTTAIGMNMGLPFFVCMALGAGISVVLALSLGLLVLRLRGHYFAVATFAVAEALRHIVTNATSLTGGGTGMNLPLPPGGIDFSARMFHLLFGVLTAITIIIVIFLERRSAGYALRAIREDEDAAVAMGIPTRVYKNLALALSAGLVSLFGSAQAYWISFLEPTSSFDIVMSIEMVLITMLGGAGTIWGPVIGGGLYLLLSEGLSSQFLDFHSMFLGLLLILLMLFMPAGVMSIFTGMRKGKSFKESFKSSMQGRSV